MKPVFAIMVTYRRFEHFKTTVESLMPTLPQGSRLLVVDNYSNDAETYKYLIGKVEEFPENIDVLMMDKNEGWGAAMNEGLRTHPEWRNFEYVLESNNDVIYETDWAARAQAMMEKYPAIGILGGFKHPYHGTREMKADGLVIKDDMPACAWLMRSEELSVFLPFPEHGPTNTRGGNGEDVAFRDKVQNKFHKWICGTEEDWAHHLDGYDIPDLGKPNPAYD